MSRPASAGTDARARFETAYAPLEPNTPFLGSVALLPWDAEIFGFGVGDYRSGESSELALQPGLLNERLTKWSRQHGVELVGCRIPASWASLSAALEAAGFRFVELQLRASLAPLRPEDTREARITVRSAEPEDHSRILSIASSAFTLGRYHADPRFPRGAADLRYRVWMERALGPVSGDGTWVAVAGPSGGARGFLHAEVSASGADIRLAAVDPEGAGIAGPELFRGALHELARRSVRQVTARISAANCAVLNIYASLGFRFHEPEVVLHWHAPGAPHLVEPAGP